MHKEDSSSKLNTVYKDFSTVSCRRNNWWYQWFHGFCPTQLCRNEQALGSNAHQGHSLDREKENERQELNFSGNKFARLVSWRCKCGTCYKQVYIFYFSSFLYEIYKVWFLKLKYFKNNIALKTVDQRRPK